MSMKQSAAAKYESVSTSPVKSFFVKMLTRDISLTDALLDLLDNCVDGILRVKGKAVGSHPYKGYYAEITYNNDTFSIHDNCGGIPWNLHKYAFKMGKSDDRPTEPSGTVGVYGIGMKRAIFKLGRHCLISTQNGDDRYEVEISPAWIDNEDLWDIPVHSARKTMKQDGTTIVVDELHPGISSHFGPDKESFTKEFRDKIASHYAFIISKGFKVTINGLAVDARPTQLIFANSDDARTKKALVRPFIYKTHIKNVDVFLAIGFTQPIPTQEDLAGVQEQVKYSALGAGWTVVCNDRAVVYCDRTELTGWGETGLPQYHNQFIAISGLVEFSSDYPEQLPTTTTKRGIDASSQLFLQVKNKMREGLRLFIDYTNRWKGREDESRIHMKNADIVPFTEVKRKVESLTLSTARGVIGGHQYRPHLPMPRTFVSDRRISFTKNINDIRAVSSYIFGDDNINASLVGEKCFDKMLQETRG